MLPHNHIKAAFDRLAADVTEPLVLDLLGSIRSTWLNSSVWSVKDLSVFKQTIRTNNDVEARHRRLNSRARRESLPLYLLIRLLHEESSYVAVQILLLSEGRLKRYQRKRYAAINTKLMELWTQYENHEVTTSRLLRSCARLTLPFGETASD